MSARHSLVAILLLLVAPGAAAAQAQRYPPQAIANSELRELPPTSSGRHYQLSIGLPRSNASEPTRRYPVVFVTDGYWEFHIVTAVRDNLGFDRVAPELIVVGLGYAGHPAEFLKTLEADIILGSAGSTSGGWRSRSSSTSRRPTRHRFATCSRCTCSPTAS
jgi:hypothetical protein